MINNYVICFRSIMNLQLVLLFSILFYKCGTYCFINTYVFYFVSLSHCHYNQHYTLNIVQYKIKYVR